ncbi:MAG: alpha/beta hydrolase [Rhodospirillaceae bacterium]|nr:alpha/beta hydrolase [Rhodospirillaceae bacterium]MYB11652.1 alpha/beta hydrolase [Rhodospirillaceae bacterium]MYI49752.1 alpha/beta hydrolase [Rhodospirillaceae bacterium]
MQRIFVLLLALSLSAAAGEAAAKTVRLADGDRILLGRLLVPDGASLADGAVLMVHGSMAHLGQETVAGVQNALAERELPSLAITLSLGESARTGMYPCEAVHRHKHSNAVREIGLWRDWLDRQGAGKVAVFGHSRGGNQIVHYALKAPPGALVAAVALAPATWSAERADSAYRTRHKRDRLADVKAAAARGDALLRDHPFLSCPSATVAASSFVDYHRNDPGRDTPGLLGAYRGAPLLVLAGREDRVVPDLIAKMAGVKNPRVGFAVVEEADHMFLDFYAEDVADRMAEFLEDKFR